MSNYKDLFNINQITDLETLNATEGTINSLTSDNFKAQSSEIDNGEFKTISVNNLNVINDLNVKNIKLNSNGIISKGDYVYTLQDKTGIIAHLDDIKTPENMVTTNTVQTIYALKTFYDGIRVKKRFGLVLGDDDTKTVTIGVSTPDANRIHSIPVTPSNDIFLMSYLTQDINGIKTFKKDINLEKNINIGTSSLINIGTSSSVSFQDKSGVISLTSDLNKYVTTNTTQTITGKKTFAEIVKFAQPMFSLYDGTLIGFPPITGNLVVNSQIINFVDFFSEQTISGNKTFTGITKFSNQIRNQSDDYFDLPLKSGTIAVTSDIPTDYVTLNNVNQTINGIKTFSNLVYFQNNISNGIYNYTFSSKSGRLLIDDDFNTLNSIVGIIKDDVTVLQDDIKLIKDDTKIINNDIILIKDDVTTLKTDVGVIKNDIIIIKDDVKTIQDNMAVKDDLKNLVTLDTNQDITAVKSFENTVYFNSGVYVKLDKRLQTGSFKCINDAVVDGVATINDLVVNNNIDCNGNFETNGGNSKACSGRYTDLNASVSKIIHLDFGSNYSFSFSGKIMITGYVELNRSKVFYLEYLVWGGRNGSYGDFYDHELIHQKDNTSSNKFVTFGFNSIANNYIKYLVSTRSTTTKTSFIINCDITYFSDASGNLTIRFVDA